ncbi:MAG: type II toxin-antitoxin system VapC family toxin [Rhodoferax sp.]|uniref:type II toxin-antitoxin system VapC family toxin n=1 Tax=Rhodoferax sp. TaxID=50421 RepID=UPI001B4E2460|nr:type II toxin-antitoxin system VapC family toxin [Rhodoferax sp.]MBP9148252.1 type II toxin-antitoxin system VapC family toxin [Rhodoferax sp.]MBP9736076.1 type II toxin-antitoxin system VapC family toxin [Rhodoferax sp.]
MILVDSSVLIDLIERTPQWYAWSAEQLFAAAQTQRVGINAIVFAEIARSFDTLAEQNKFLESTGLVYLHLPAAAAFQASQAHRAYRAAGGSKAATLPDFFIGAHARVDGHTLMTRDAKRMHTYFPDVPVISPR